MHNPKHHFQTVDEYNRPGGLKKGGSYNLPFKNVRRNRSLPSLSNNNDSELEAEDQHSDMDWKRKLRAIQRQRENDFEEARRREANAASTLSDDRIDEIVKRKYRETIDVIEEISRIMKNPKEREKTDPAYIYERAERVYSHAFKKIVQELERVRNGRIIGAVLEKVWRNYISSFEFFIKLRETEKKHSEKKISGLEKEIKALKDKVRQMEKDKLQRKVRKESKMKMKVRQHALHVRSAKKHGVIISAEVSDVESEDSDVEKPYDFIDRSMKLVKKTNGSGADKKLRFLLKDLLEQNRNEFVPVDWASAMLSEEVFGVKQPGEEDDED